MDEGVVMEQHPAANKINNKNKNKTKLSFYVSSWWFDYWAIPGILGGDI